MAASIRAGDVLAGRYRMVDLLGEAEGGWFWCAHDEILHRPVAVHLLDDSDDRAAVLMDAARRAAALNDRRNLRVLDADSSDGVAYVVNEWGQGESLDLVLAADGPMAPERAAWLVAEVADTIARAHAAGVSHDHLLPEHVLIDDHGEIRIIGLAVDAALHGVPVHRAAEDVTHLGALLYAALTGKWPGPGVSAVAEAPSEHGKVLRPRQVRAGIPRALDRICDEMLIGGDHSRSLGLGSMLGQRAEHDLTTAAGVREALEEFLGEGAGAQAGVDQPDPGAHGANGPYTNGRRVPAPIMPPVPTPAEGMRFPGSRPPQETAAAPEEPSASPVDLPTEAGMPVFHDEDVEWLRARAHKPAPPPEFEQPEERPLYAPETPESAAARRARPQQSVPRSPDEYWPWDSSGGPPTGSGNDSGFLPPVGPPVPGRSWLRLAWIVGVGALLLLGLVAAYQLGVGSGDEPPPSDQTQSGTPTVGSGDQILPLTAVDFDPQGDTNEENGESAPLAVDGDPGTAWPTQTYKQQFGPGGLKTGVGLLLDLGGDQQVSQVQVTVRGGETAAQVYLSDGEPSSLEGLEPVGAAAGDGVVTISFDAPANATHVVVWLTRIPGGAGAFRGEITEIEVFG